MGLRSLLRALTACTVCFAVLFAMLAPVISHAVVAAGGIEGVGGEICSAVRANRSVEARRWNAPAPMQATQGEHCPLCLPHSDSPALPTMSPALFPLTVVALERSDLIQPSRRPILPWVHARSRAPPQQA